MDQVVSLRTTAAMVQMTPHLRLTYLTKLLGRDLSALRKAAQRLLEGKGQSGLAGGFAKRLIPLLQNDTLLSIGRLDSN